MDGGLEAGSENTDLWMIYHGNNSCHVIVMLDVCRCESVDDILKRFCFTGLLTSSLVLEMGQALACSIKACDI